MVARREWTREWWDDQRSHYEVVTSIAVLEELERGAHPQKAKVLDLLSAVPLLAVEDPIVEIVDTYVRERLMPQDVRGDALHLALASYHRCQFLLTWNCRHLANANKFEHIRHVNNLLGLYTPTLTTPGELLTWEEAY